MTSRGTDGTADDGSAAGWQQTAARISDRPHECEHALRGWPRPRGSAASRPAAGWPGSHWPCRRRRRWRPACRRAEGRRLDRTRLPLPHRRSAARAAAALHDRRRAIQASRCWSCTAPPAPAPACCAGLRGRAVRRRASRSTREILHHSSRRDRRGQVLQAFRRPAREVSRATTTTTWSRPIPAGHRRLGHPPSASGHRQLDGRHARLDLGRDVSRLHGCAGADGLAADRDVRPQLDDAAHADRCDPQRSGVERRQLHGAAALAANANVFFGIATNGGTLAY